MNDIKYGRKRNGIKLELKKKIEDWLSSIDDEGLRDKVRKDVIVTGGSIASMLLGEKVNDFDLYFRTFNTAKAIAEYYVAKFNKTKPELEPEVRCTEDRVKVFIQSAGVAAESFDFEEQTEAYLDGLSEAEGKKEKYRPVFLSENAITLSDKVQLCIRFWGESDKIHENYDFVHATCSWDHKNEELRLPPEALECLLSRTLIYQGSLYPMASIFRMKKFIERGWRISAGQQLKIMWQISELDLTDTNVLYEQLTGVDMNYMFMLKQALANEELLPEQFNAHYVGEVIDRIFQETMR